MGETFHARTNTVSITKVNRKRLNSHTQGLSHLHLYVILESPTMNTLSFYLLTICFSLLTLDTCGGHQPVLRFLIVPSGCINIIFCAPGITYLPSTTTNMYINSWDYHFLASCIFAAQLSIYKNGLFECCYHSRNSWIK